MAAVMFVIGPCPNPGCTRFHGVTTTKRPASRSGADDLTAAGGRAREDIGVGPGLRPLGVTRSDPPPAWSVRPGRAGGAFGTRPAQSGVQAGSRYREVASCGAGGWCLSLRPLHHRHTGTTRYQA